MLRGKNYTQREKVLTPNGFIYNHRGLNLSPRLKTLTVYTATNPNTDTKFYCCIPEVAQRLQAQGYTLTAHVFKVIP